MKDQDSIFFKNFSIMLGALVLLTIILAIVGYNMHSSLLGDDVVVKDRSAVENMIKPVAKVNTGDAIIAEQSEVVTDEPVADEPVVATGPADPAQTYQMVCFACHGTGAAGAPKLETAAWDGRLEKGLDALTASAINGIGVMPPKGGRMDLSDDEIKAVVEFMLKDL